MFCQHKWYEISREFYDGNRSIAWCETCGELKFTNYQQKERPLVVFRTPKIMKRKNSPLPPTNNERDVICTNSPCAYCVNENKDCKPIDNFACFHGCKLTPVS